MQYCSLQHLYFHHQSHPQQGVVLLWLCLFILSGVTAPLIFNSILGTYQPGEFIFQCPIFLPFHTAHGVLNARILKWFSIPFYSGPCLVRMLHHDLSILCGPLVTFILGGSKITADGDCSHEIKSRLLLGRKVMTNLDSILRSRDITLPTKVLLVRALVFPVVMYGYESWTIKKAEHRRIDAFEL